VLFWLLVAGVLGGIVHIAAMLVIPTLAPKSGYSRYEAMLEPNVALVAGPATPGDMPFPFASPDAVYVICRYDVSQDPVHFTAQAPDIYWSLALFEPNGGNFYHINSFQAPSQNADLFLLGRGDELEAGDEGVVTRATTPRGLIVMRLHLRDRTTVQKARDIAERADCSSFEIE
jgi:uncharacterized membrane protein